MKSEKKWQQIQLNVLCWFRRYKRCSTCVGWGLLCCTWVSTGGTTVAVDWNTWHNCRQHFPSKPTLIPDWCCCLPVIGNFFTEIPLLHKPVQYVIAHVGFGPFHAFDINVPFCHIKVVLHHWSCCWLLPKELICNLFPESWNKVILNIRHCTQTGSEGGEMQGNTASTALKIQTYLTYLLDSQETSCTVPDRSWNQAHEHPSSCHQEGNTFCPEIQAQPLWKDRCRRVYIIWELEYGLIWSHCWSVWILLGKVRTLQGLLNWSNTI